MALVSWEPTTNTIVLVTNVSQVVLPANPLAVVRVLQPLSTVVVWVGLDEPAAVAAGVPITFILPWKGDVASGADTPVMGGNPMYRGAMTAVHNFEDGVTIPMLVLEGEVP